MADEETPASEVQETEAAAPAAEETTVQGDGTAEVEQTAEEEATEVAAPVTEDAPPAEAPPDSQEATDASPEGEEATQGEETSAPVEGDEATPQTEAGKPGEEEREGEVTTEEAEGEMTEGAEPEGGQEEGAEAEQEPSEDTTGPAEATEGETVAAEETDGQEKVEEEGEAAAEVADKAGEQQEAGAEGADEAQAPPAEGEQDTQPASPLPQSDTFAEGERPETPVVAVMEPLSREGSPQPEPEPLEAGTPERIESPQEEEEFDDEEPWISREELIEAYQAAQSEREQLQNQNIQLQHKLAEYFRKKKTDDQRQEMDKNVTDQEQRYLKYMSNLEELRRQEEEERDDLSEQLEELKGRRQEKLDTVEQETDLFSQLKRQSAENAINSRTGKAIAPKDIEAYLLNEAKKEEEVKQVRLENIKLRNRLRKREQQLKAKEELAEGLHLIDFEQLKIENQTYNEKIEERNEELLKLRKKITSTVQELTHVKEKLQFVQAENQVQKGKLKEVESLVAQKRDILSRTKKARDSLRIDNQRLRQKSGLLGNTPLLRDFEERKDEGDELRAKLERLKRQHAELTLSCSGVRRKIEEARSGRS
ncbi:coiled-coil domain-containing protein 96-like [Acanthaster planci]|uniref:Coiled-coil domain-containing protein 96-like n=1 Tax=Acanthaster planci TaxID=133434 RepID=A0A8B7XJV1_ACAPL|nr:coiled-coil domain-containing protein 96-like [Acanthaster planci]